MMIWLSILALVMTFNPGCPSYSVQSNCTVTLMNGTYTYTTLTEEYSGKGVVLPELSDTADWHFIGWTDTQFHTVYQKPDIIAAGTYHPKQDITLWAVYQYRPADPDEYMSDVKTGDYLYVNRETNIALKGEPDKDGRMGYTKTNKYDERLVYHIDFVAPDTAYITYKESNTPIGYSSKKMAAKASPWLVYHSGEETLFYANIENKTYVLWLNILDSQDAGTYAGLMQAKPSASPMSLMVAKERPMEAYTCYPESELGIDAVQNDAPAGEYILPLGNFRLRIRSGHKYLQIEK